VRRITSANRPSVGRKRMPKSVVFGGFRYLLLDGNFADQQENLDQCDHNQQGNDDDREHTIHDLILDRGYYYSGK